MTKMMYDKVTKKIAVPLLEPYVSKFNDGSILLDPWVS